jgi:hypothetical protein
MVGVEPTSAALELRAERLRRQLAQDLGDLSTNLKPQNLYREALQCAGIEKMSISKTIDVATRQHPVPAVLGIGALGFFSYFLIRKSGGARYVEDIKSAAAQTASSLAESATGVFHQHIAEKKREFFELAQTQITAGASKLSDEIEKKISDTVDALPGSAEVKPLLVSGVQILLATALGALLRPSVR